jgi:hypothetical protein
MHSVYPGSNWDLQISIAILIKMINCFANPVILSLVLQWFVMTCIFLGNIFTIMYDLGM